MSTERESSVAKALGRMTGADLARFVDFVSSNSGNFNLNSTERYYLMREILKYVRDHKGDLP